MRGQRHTQATLLPGKGPGAHCTADKVGVRSGLNGTKNLPPTGVRCSDGPASRKSLYKLRYLGRHIYINRLKFFKIKAKNDHNILVCTCYICCFKRPTAEIRWVIFQVRIWRSRFQILVLKPSLMT